MIVVRAPYRISFAGGGTDIGDFYRRRQGRVLSATIAKYMYIVLNRTPLSSKVSVRYTVSETVNHPRYLKHDRVRAALLDLGILGGIEIASFSEIPVMGGGLGSSSSFSVALMKGLYAYRNKHAGASAAAEAAARLEIELLGEPVGKQDQYAAAFGGINILEFDPDESVRVVPVLLGFKELLKLQDHLLLFFTGTTRSAAAVLTEQRANLDSNFATLSEMADSVLSFRDRLEAGDYAAIGELLHRGWLLKKSLSPRVSNSLIDGFYSAGISAGAWGGKLLGAGQGGCILFLAPHEKHDAVCLAVREFVTRHGMDGCIRIPVEFSQSGVEVLFSDQREDGA